MEIQMEFLKGYQEKIEKFRTKYYQMVAETEEDHNYLMGLKAKYDSLVSSLDFEGANKMKVEIKNLEASIETKEDLINILKEKVNNGDADAAKEAAILFKKENENHLKKSGSLIKQAEKKRAEFIEVLRDIDQFNSLITVASRQLQPLEKVVQWSSPEVVNELGFDFSQSIRRDSGSIKLYEYFIKDYSAIRD